jgi:hypothetical protein
MSYMDEVRARAKRRKSPWNLLLIPAVLGPWLLLSWFSWVEFGKLHELLHPEREFVILPEGLSGILMAVAPLFAWLVPSMVVGNLLVAAIGPAKRVLDVEAKSVPGTDLSSSNRSLLRLSLVMTPAALLVGFIGACTTW